MSTTSYQLIWQTDRARLEQCLDRRLSLQNQPSDRVVEAMRYSLLGAGKRIRALLLLSLGRILDISEDLLFDYATALEMIHAYSLVHDDLPAMDNDNMRRGKPSCHIRYSEALAILAGDGLLNTALEILIKLGGQSPGCLAASIWMARSAGVAGMITGQTMDLAAPRSADKQVLESWFLQMVDKKTGALITASLMVPALIASIPEPARRDLSELATFLGRYYQFQDDFLDAGEKDRDNQPKLTAYSLYGRDLLAEKLRQLENKLAQGLAEFQKQYGYDLTALVALIKEIFRRRF